VLPVSVHEHALKWRGMYLPFDFEVRFTVKEGVVRFQVQEREA
jgi:hypothetical protein